MDPRTKLVTRENIFANVKRQGDCLLWTGAKSGAGYGQCGTACRGVHRRSYELFVGPIPKGHMVLHKCDTPACINPEHLFTGTSRLNMLDKMAKGRHRTVKRKGFKPHFTDAQVRAIRAEAYLGPTRLGIKYGCWRHTITSLLHGRTYAHVQ